MFEWMAWTLPVMVFFACIVLMLAGNAYMTGQTVALSGGMSFL